MVSHKNVGGLELSVGGGGIRFKKRPSQFNIKVGKCMKQKGVRPTDGGRYDKSFQKAFVDCAQQAGANLSDSAKSKWGV